MRKLKEGMLHMHFMNYLSFLKWEHMLFLKCIYFLKRVRWSECLEHLIFLAISL